MEWYAAESTAEEKPKELDITSSPHLVYKRRNIERVPMSNENEESKAGEKWVYEECTQDKEEYESQQAELLSPTTEAIMQEIKLRDEYIKLGQALKAAGVVDSGVTAKLVILDEKVKVNGEVEVQRGKKLYDGDVVEALGETIKIVK